MRRYRGRGRPGTNEQLVRDECLRLIPDGGWLFGRTLLRVGLSPLSENDNTLGNRYNRGESFVIEARNASKENKYIQSVTLNGKPITGFKIPQQEVLKGGRMVIEMGKEASKDDVPSNRIE